MAKTLSHFVRYFLHREPAETQTTLAERAALSRHAAKKLRLAEIGVFEGVTSALIAEAMGDDGVLYAIDPFFPGRLGICWGKWITWRETSRVRLRKKIIFIEKLSHDAVADVPGDLDFLFVDGDHSLAGITCDWKDWSPRIAPGGLVALHDTLVPAHNPKVAQLGSCQYFGQQIQHDPRFRIVEQVDSLSILQRTGLL